MIGKDWTGKVERSFGDKSVIMEDNPPTEKGDCFLYFRTEGRKRNLKITISEWQ